MVELAPLIFPLFRRLFFVELTKLDLKYCKSTFNTFENFHDTISIQSVSNVAYNVHNSSGIHLLTRLRFGLSNFNEHKFHHNFEKSINPLCTRTLEVE